MSWMRSPLYVWSDGENVSISVGAFGEKVLIPEAELEDLAVMVAAELVEEGRLQEVAKRAAGRHSGNVGCDALDGLLGRPKGFEDAIRALPRTDGGVERPSAFIQWKGTDVCMDVYCTCGEQFHVDAEFVYFVRCLACGATYEVGTNVALTPVDDPEKEAFSSVGQSCPQCKTDNHGAPVFAAAGDGRLLCLSCGFVSPAEGVRV